MLEAQDGYACLVDAFYGLHRALRMNPDMDNLETDLQAYVTTLDNLLAEVELRKGIVVFRVTYVFHEQHLSTQLVYRNITDHGGHDYVGTWRPTPESRNFLIRDFPRAETLVTGLVARAKQIVLEFIAAKFDAETQAGLQCGPDNAFVKPPSAED